MAANDQTKVFNLFVFEQRFLLVLDKMAANESSNFSQLHYEECLIPSLPKQIQHRVHDITNYAVRLLGILTAVMSLLCNTLVFFTVTRTKSLRHPSLLILCSLSVTDVVFSLQALIREVFILSRPQMSMCLEPFSEVGLYLRILCYLATLSNLVVISKDRYLAISKPSWYHAHMTKSRAIKTILVSWLVSTMATLAVFTIANIGFSVTLFFIVIFLFYVICVFMIVFNYVRFLIANRRHTRIMGRNMRSVVQREKKMSQLVSVILLSFLFSFFPALILPIVLVAIRLPLDPFRPFNILLMTVNGLLNPLLNYSRNRNMRRAMRNLLKCHGGGGQLQTTGRKRRNLTQSDNAPNESHREMAHEQLRF